MLNFVIVGLNHRTAKLDFRQLFSFSAERLESGLRRLSENPGVVESMIVSTCNRVEILCAMHPETGGVEAINSFMSGAGGVPATELASKLYCHRDREAVRHLFRVASSLDSMVLGEPQILGQLKSCYNTAVEVGTVGAGLNGLLQSAFRTAKRVRSETSIGEYSVSVSSAAVELVRKIFGDLRKKSILIVGAGKMGEAAVAHLAESGVNAVYLTNRSPERARALAERRHGVAVPFEELPEWIARVDIVISSTGASDTLIDRDMVQGIMRTRGARPIVFIDIAAPRNVDPGVAAIDNVFFYDIDDLAAVVEANLQERKKAAAAAEKIVEQEVESFCSRSQSTAVGPVVHQLQDRIEEICKAELERCLKKIGPQEPKQLRELETMIARIAGKIAHPLVMQLRESSNAENGASYMEVINRILKPRDVK